MEKKSAFKRAVEMVTSSSYFDKSVVCVCIQEQSERHREPPGITVRTHVNQARTLHVCTVGQRIVPSDR